MTLIEKLSDQLVNRQYYLELYFELVLIEICCWCVCV